MGYHEIIVEDYEIREMLGWTRSNFGEDSPRGDWFWSRRDWKYIVFYFRSKEDAALFKLFWN